MSNGGNGVGGGGGNSNGGDSNSNSGSATEYTLQGVMRFLQMEWHNHERARNGWDIERAEMKVKIAKQEGENRRAVKLNEQLDRHVRMMEIALKRERAKVKAFIAGGAKLPDNYSDDYLWSQSDPKNSESKLNPEPAAALAGVRNAGKEALQRAVEEITYLMAPSHHPILPGEVQFPLGDQPPLDLGDPYFAGNQQRSSHIPHLNAHGERESVPSESDPRSIPINQTGVSDSYQNSHSYGPAFLPPDKVPHNIRQQPSNHITEQFPDDASGWSWDTAQSGDDNSTVVSGSTRGPPSSALSTFPRNLPKSGSKASNKARNRANAPRRGFNVRFELSGHLDVVRAVIFTGGGSQTDPELCTAGDDGVIKRWLIPSNQTSINVQSFVTHRGHEGSITCLAACSPSPVREFSHDGSWIFSGGQDGTIRLWERDRVDAVAVIHDHTDAVWAVRVLPGMAGTVFGSDHPSIEDPNSLILVSGSADGTVKIWAIGAPQRLPAPTDSSQPTSDDPQSLHYSPEESTVFVAVNLIHSIQQETLPSPTCIAPLSTHGLNFVVSYNDASILVINTLTGEIISSMQSTETYNNTVDTGVNCVVALPSSHNQDNRNQLPKDDNSVHGATGSMSDGGVEGIIISGHEDQYIRIFDANSGQCTYTMRAHPSSVSSLSLATSRRDVQEVVSAGHDGGVRIWDLRKRACIQEFASHRVMRDEGACAVTWGPEPFGHYIVSVGGDSVVKVYAKYSD